MQSTQNILTFECRPCGNRFQAAGDLEEWTSVIYGPCREYRAACPACGERAGEYRPKPAARGEAEFGSEENRTPCGRNACGEGACAEGPCGSGSCPMD